MKVLVGVKRVVDYAVKVRVANNTVDLNNVKMSLNPFCEIAVEEAVRLKESGVASEVIACSIGPKQCTETIRTSLAMGCDRGIHIHTPDASSRIDYIDIQPQAVAKIFQKVIEKEDPSLVLLGKQGIDSDCGQVGPYLAGLLNWSQITFASKIDKSDDADNKLEVERETDSGTETIEVTTPSIITCDLRLNEPRYATLPNIMKAKKKKVETINAEDMDVDLTPKNIVESIYEPPPRKEGIKVESVDDLLDKLKNEAKVLS